MRKRILLAAYCALLCITVTFSWLFDIVPNHVKEVVIDYKDRGHLFIANANMRGSLFMQDPSGTYVEVDESFSFDGNRLIPNAVIPFNIDIQNTGSSNISFMMTLLMRVEDPRLLDVLYIDAVLPTDASKHVYKKLSEAERVGENDSNEYALTLFSAQNKLSIKGSTEEEDPKIALKCYLYFDRSADITYQGLELEILSFRLEQ